MRRYIKINEIERISLIICAHFFEKDLNSIMQIVEKIEGYINKDCIK